MEALFYGRSEIPLPVYGRHQRDAKYAKWLYGGDPQLTDEYDYPEFNSGGEPDRAGGGSWFRRYALARAWRCGGVSVQHTHMWCSLWCAYLLFELLCLSFSLFVCYLSLFVPFSGALSLSPSLS